MMSLDEPTCLPVGTEVSAKYRGAFCEAKVKKVVKTVKVKVNLKDGGNLVCLDEDIKGTLRLGATVEVKHPENSQYVEGTVMKVTDGSVYTVVFDDGDENTLRRTQLCLKGEKHFVKTDTLDELPLTHPEHFGTPVMKGGSRKRRRSPASALSDDSDSDDDSSDDDTAIPKRRYGSRLEGLVGRVVLMEQEDRKRTLHVPVLITQPSADNTVSLKTREHVLVKSFKDGKFYSINRKQTKEFIEEIALKNEDKVLKIAMDRAMCFLNKKELPGSWSKEDLLGSETEDDEDDDVDESSDDEPTEEKDRFVATLYKFMDDRGTPINKVPAVGNRDLDLYRLFTTLQKLGGYNKVSNQMKWRLVNLRMRLPATTLAGNQTKAAYKKYLHAFEDFYRKLGSTMGTISRPIRGPRTPGPSRSIFREKDRDTTPKSPARSNVQAKKKKEEEENHTKKTRRKVNVKVSTPKPAKDKEERPEKTEMKTRSKKEESLPESREESETESDSPRKRSTRGAVEHQKGKEEAVASSVPTPVVRRPVSREENRPSRAIKDDSSTESRAKDDSSVGSRTKDDETTSENGDVDASLATGRPPRRRVRKKRYGEEDDCESVKSAGKPSQVASKTVAAAEKPSTPKSMNPPRPPSSTGDSDTEDKENDEEDDCQSNPSRDSAAATPLNAEYPVGSRLKVKYGKGKIAKVYDAKVVEVAVEGGSLQYKVHYAGWNIRYDEWVRRDRIVSMVERGCATTQQTPPTAPPAPAIKTKEKKVERGPSKQQQSRAVGSKASPANPPVVAPSSSSSGEASSGRVPRSSKSPTPAPAPAPSKPPRPTRSTSMESPLVHGLPPRTLTRKRRARGTGVRESDAQSRGSSVSDSDAAASDDDEPELESKSSQKSSEKALPEEEEDDGPPQLHQESSVTTAVKEDPFEFKNEETDKISSPKRPVQLNKSPKQPVIEVKKVSEDVISKAVKSPAKADVPKPSAVASTAKAEVKPAPAKEPRSQRLLAEIKEADSGKDSDVSESDLRTPSKRRGRKRQLSESEESKKVAEKDSAKVIVDVKQEVKTEDSVVEVKSAKKRATKTVKSAEKAQPTATEAKVKPKGKRKLMDIKVEESDDVKPEPPLESKKARRKLVKRKVDTDLDEQGECESPVKVVRKEVCEKNTEVVEPALSLPQPTTSMESSAAAAGLPVSPLYKPAPLLSLPTEQERNSGGECDDTAPHLSPVIRSAPTASTDSAAAPAAATVPLPSAVPLADIAEPVAPVIPSPPQPQEAASPTATSPVPAVANDDAGADTADAEADADADAADDTEPAKVNAPAPLLVETPPYSPPRWSAPATTAPTPPTSSMPAQQTSPAAEGSTKSEHDANLEVESLMSRSALAADSPACDMSTVSVGSGGGSSGNAPSSESDDQNTTTTTTRSKQEQQQQSKASDGEEEEEEHHPPKRRRRGHKRAIATDKPKRGSKAAACSDSDGDTNEVVKHQATHHTTALNLQDPQQPRGTSKYNFLDLGEAKFLSGEKKIEFLVDRIKELRGIYMNIKSEVALIDRKRKRARRREREAASNTSQQEGVEGS